MGKVVRVLGKKLLTIGGQQKREENNRLRKTEKEWKRSGNRGKRLKNVDFKKSRIKKQRKDEDKKNLDKKKKLKNVEKRKLNDKRKKRWKKRTAEERSELKN